MTPRGVIISDFREAAALAVSGSETASRAAAIDVTNFAISMAASLAGVALAEVLVPSVLMLMAVSCLASLGGAATSLATLLQRSLAPHDGLQLLS